MLNGTSTPNRTEICMIKVGADGEIRTHEKSYLLTPYKSVALDHSATTAKLKYIGGPPRNRTGTALSDHQILSLTRLPIPP